MEKISKNKLACELRGWAKYGQNKRRCDIEKMAANALDGFDEIGCGCCRGGETITGEYFEPLQSEHDEYLDTILTPGVWIHGDELTVGHLDSAFRSTVINYCPMCGRKL